MKIARHVFRKIMSNAGGTNNEESCCDSDNCYLTDINDQHQPSELVSLTPNGSELGTKNYWDNIYHRDLKLFSDCGDPGEIWFGESSETRILNFLLNDDISKDSQILDIGCGNGHLCVQLAGHGFTRVWGVDYCADAVALAQQFADRESSDVASRVTFTVADFLDPVTTDAHLPAHGSVNVAIDKGTYDAISLIPGDPVGTDKRQEYRTSLSRLVSGPGSWFLLTSCNWTADELLHQFTEGREACWALHRVLPGRKFQFGGRVGADTTCVVFRRKC